MEEKNNIFDSCLIVEKGSILINTTCDQAVAAAKQNGANNNQSIATIGFKCIDWIKHTLEKHNNGTHVLTDGEVAKLQKEIELYQILPDKSAYGFLTESEVIEKRFDKLSGIPITKLKYN